MLKTALQCRVFYVQRSDVHISKELGKSMEKAYLVWKPTLIFINIIYYIELYSVCSSLKGKSGMFNKKDGSIYTF